MAGTKKGGIKAAKTNRLRYGEKFYNVIGRAGGKKSTGGGFASDYVDENGLTGRQRAAEAGHKGGKNSWEKRMWT